MTPDDIAGDQPTKPLPQDPGPTEPIVAPHVPVADLSTAPFDSAGAAPASRAPSRLGMWALVGIIALLGISVIVIGTLWLQRDGQPTPGTTPTPSTSVTTPPAVVDDGDEAPSETPVEPEPEPTTPPEPKPTTPPEPEPTEPPAQ